MKKGRSWIFYLVVCVLFFYSPNGVYGAGNSGQIIEGLYFVNNGFHPNIKLDVLIQGNNHYDKDTYRFNGQLQKLLLINGWDNDGLWHKSSIRIIVGEENPDSKRQKERPYKGAMVIWLESGEKCYIEFGIGWKDDLLRKITR